MTNRKRALLRVLAAWVAAIAAYFAGFLNGGAWGYVLMAIVGISLAIAAPWPRKVKADA